MGKLDGKTAIVTGASRGIGEEIAKLFASEGAKVICVARTLKEGDHQLAGSLETTVEAIKSAGGEATAIASNISEAEQCQSLVKEAREVYGPIDILVNNAALMYPLPTKDYPINRWMRSWAVNVHAPFMLSQLVLEDMIAKKSGSIVNISSGAAIVGLKNLSSYSVSKSSMQILFESARNEFLQFNVYFKNFFPGTINTEFEKKAKNYGLFEKKKVKKKSVEKAAIKILNSLYTKRFNNFVSTSTMASFILKSMPSINKY